MNFFNPIWSLVKINRQFVSAWLKSPLQVGAIVPSSIFLAGAMVDAAKLLPNSKVIELGPGTGNITQAIIDNGVSEENLILIESDEGFSIELRKKYPTATIITGDAFLIVEELANRGLKYSAIVSSLPLLNYSRVKSEFMTTHIVNLLSANGHFVQYTYGFSSPVSDVKTIVAMKVKRVWLNIPPAAIWVYQINKQLPNEET